MVVRRTRDRGLSDRSYLHLRELERVLVAMPGFPVDSVSVAGVPTAEVETVEIGRMTATVPPTAFEELSTAISLNVVIPVIR